jgi:cytochrome bd-type quinol oxidase subunit 1
MSVKLIPIALLHKLEALEVEMHFVFVPISTGEPVCNAYLLTRVVDKPQKAGDELRSK